MSTPLHAPDVLIELASGPPGPARDWANTLLAVTQPDAVTGLPDDTYDSALVLAAGAPAGAVEVRKGLQGGETTDAAALRCEQVTAMGLLPADPGDWAHAAREALRGDGSPRDLYLAQLLAELDALDGASLSAASQVSGPEAEMALPAMVLRFAAVQNGETPDALDPTARAVAGQLRDRDATPVGIRNVLALLGVPHLAVGDLEDEAAVVQAVAQRMGKGPPAHGRPKGAPRRRAQKVVRELLDGVPGAAAAMVRAASEAELGDATAMVAAATWARLRTASDPLEAVLHELAGEDRRLLSGARRQVREAKEVDAPLRATLSDQRLELCPQVLLVLDHAGDDGAAWLEPMLERFVRDPDIDLRAGLATTLLFARTPERVAAMVADRATRSAGLLFARLTPTEEVLAALLELPMPGTENQMELYVQALSDMADPAALPALQRVVDAGHRSGAEGLARAEQLLGR